MVTLLGYSGEDKAAKSAAPTGAYAVVLLEIMANEIVLSGLY